MGKSTEPQKNALIRIRGDAYHIVAVVSQEQKSTTQPSMVLVTVDMFTPIFTSLFRPRSDTESYNLCRQSVSELLPQCCRP